MKASIIVVGICISMLLCTVYCFQASLGSLSRRNPFRNYRGCRRLCHQQPLALLLFKKGRLVSLAGSTLKEVLESPPIMPSSLMTTCQTDLHEIISTLNVSQRDCLNLDTLESIVNKLMSLNRKLFTVSRDLMRYQLKYWKQRRSEHPLIRPVINTENCSDYESITNYNDILLTYIRTMATTFNQKACEYLQYTPPHPSIVNSPRPPPEIFFKHSLNQSKNDVVCSLFGDGDYTVDRIHELVCLVRSCGVMFSDRDVNLRLGVTATKSVDESILRGAIDDAFNLGIIESDELQASLILLDVLVRMKEDERFDHGISHGGGQHEKTLLAPML